MTPSIAVIIPVKDGAATIGRAIRSVLAQTLPAAELLVVANGTTDDTLLEVARFGSAVRTVTLPEGGHYAARRAGFEATRAPLVLFLDADDELHPRALAEAAEVMEATEADMVQLRLVQTFRLRGGLTLRRPYPCRYRLDQAVEGALGAVSEFHPGIAAKLFRRELLTPLPDIGYQGFWGEDRLFSLELYGRSPEARLAYAPRARYLYTYGGGSATPTAPEADAAFREVYGLMRRRLAPLGLEEYRLHLEAYLARLLADRRRAALPLLRRPTPRALLRRLLPALLRR